MLSNKKRNKLFSGILKATEEKSRIRAQICNPVVWICGSKSVLKVKTSVPEPDPGP
jgi:hypothetical protein